jgi:hypothetical protein
LLLFGHGEALERVIETIILKRFKRGLQRLALLAGNGRERLLRVGKTGTQCKEEQHTEIQQDIESAGKRL